MQYPLRDRIALGAALAGPLALGLVLVPFRTGVSHTNLALIFVVAVVAISALGNRFAGAIAALSSACWFDFLLTRPYQQFTIAGTGDLETAVLLLAVGLVVSQLAARARTMRMIAITDAAHLARLHDTARLVHSGSPDAVVGQVRQQLVDVLGLAGCRFEYGTLLGHPPRLDQDGGLVVARRRWDIERLGWPEGEVELRVAAEGLFLGRFMLSPVAGSVPSLQARLVAVSLADQAGAALSGARPVPET
ncbi:DUF4118 domain-containing protein [Streptomyces bugieae]|uniref:DUF4118 domain-containing protein n=1 Tax=Streptomyces bugieae TaxID=3098223 RepID=A0ABU7NTF7_9ACTN|nr:DUF4118 domain-containing protein [Streptomyces sp. DSM 41528]